MEHLKFDLNFEKIVFVLTNALLAIIPQELKRRYERLNMLTMHALERERGGQHGVSTLDLHGFHVDEAQDERVLVRELDEHA